MNEELTIMLIDDDKDDTRLFAESAQEVDPGITCVTIRDGIQALQYLNNFSNSLPDFIFLDLRMPGISGKSCLREIKSNSRLASIPVFVYTTSRDQKDVQELEALGAVMFITKPVNPQDIYYVISNIIGEQWS